MDTPAIRIRVSSYRIFVVILIFQILCVVVVFTVVVVIFIVCVVLARNFILI